MKRLIFILIALAAAVWIGLNLHRGPGIIVVSFAGWRIDAPLWLGLLALLLAYILLYYILSVISGVVYIAKNLKTIAANFSKKRANQLNIKGFIAAFEGKWAMAEQALVQSAHASDMPWLNYLFAAKAAQAQGEEKRSDNYLDQAHKQSSGTQTAITLTSAKLHYQRGQYQQSLHLLKDLYVKMPTHPTVLKLLQEVYIQLGDWENLRKLLPKIKQSKNISPQKYQALENRVWTELLRVTCQDKSDLATTKLWQTMPKRLRQEMDIVLLYVNFLQLHQKFVEAQMLIKETLKHQWDERLIRLYGKLIHPDPKKLLTTAEKWLKEHPNSPGLLFTLGLLCEGQQLWGKAQHYFEASLEIAPDPKTYAQLGVLLEKLNKPELSAQYFKKGLLLDAPIKMATPFGILENP